MNNFYFHGGPTWLEWVAGLCDKVNELITAINNINKNGVKNPHKLTFTGDVEAEYDGSKDVTVDISGGGGGGGESDKLWYPYIVEKVLNWRKTTSTTTPTPFDLNQLKGDTGSDGYSPTANVTQTATGATITITDKTGTTTAKLKNGTDGTDGTNGTDGFSPSAKVTTTPDGARITITDKAGTTTADVTNGADGSDGATGPAGAAAGFGVVDATATTGTTAGATVTTDGPDTAKNMHFAFTIPTGGGGGTGDVTAAGNNTFSGTNNFTGRVDFESNVYLGDNTHVNTPTSNENATNKLYVDTVTGTAQTTAVNTAKNYTDEQLTDVVKANVKQTDTGATIEVTDKSGTTTAYITNGKNGTNGSDGFSPSANVAQTETGATITITDKTGTTTAEVKNGKDGKKGDTGPAGPYTNIEIGSVTTGEPGTNAEATFDTSTPGVAQLDLKIPRGAPGADGATGPAGHDGAPGSAAGFGTVDATATTGTTAGATVTTDGPDTAKNMHFAFTIPTGGGGGGTGGPRIVKCALQIYGSSSEGYDNDSYAVVYVYDDYMDVFGVAINSSGDTISFNWLMLIPESGTLPEVHVSGKPNGMIVFSDPAVPLAFSFTTINGNLVIQGVDANGKLKQANVNDGQTAYFHGIVKYK